MEGKGKEENGKGREEKKKERGEEGNDRKGRGMREGLLLVPGSQKGQARVQHSDDMIVHGHLFRHILSPKDIDQSPLCRLK